jgi:hypothetical protein
MRELGVTIRRFADRHLPRVVVVVGLAGALIGWGLGNIRSEPWATLSLVVLLAVVAGMLVAMGSGVVKYIRWWTSS